MNMGPGATEKQIAYIHNLLGRLGYKRIDSAVRRRYNLTQREAGGGFTRTEASELIDRLKADLEAQ